MRVQTFLHSVPMLRITCPFPTSFGPAPSLDPTPQSQIPTHVIQFQTESRRHRHIANLPGLIHLQYSNIKTVFENFFKELYFAFVSVEGIKLFELKIVRCHLYTNTGLLCEGPPKKNSHSSPSRTENCPADYYQPCVHVPVV